MRDWSLRTAVCLTLVALTATSASAGVRGKPTKLKDPIPTSQRLAQGDSDYGGVNSHPVPLPQSATITNERVIQETTVPIAPTVTDPNSGCTAPVSGPNTVYVAVPAPMPPQLPMMPMVAPPPMPLMPSPGCATCGGYGYGGYGYGGSAYGAYGYGGLSPMAAALYNQSFGPGLYRTGAEAGQFHYPYYSYRRPWYFPGQPSFHRSTDYVW